MTFDRKFIKTREIKNSFSTLRFHEKSLFCHLTENPEKLVKPNAVFSYFESRKKFVLSFDIDMTENL